MTNKGSNPFARVYENLRKSELENHRLIDLNRFFAALQELKIFKLAKIGVRVAGGGQKSKKRVHELGDLIEQTYNALATNGHEPTTGEVLKALKAYDGAEIIQEITDDTINWINWRNIECKMKISTLGNRLTKIRKRRKQA